LFLSGVSGESFGAGHSAMADSGLAQSDAAPGHSTAVWHQRPLRIYHPNARAFEMESLDVKGFISDCKATGAEAVW
jgi:hypothetical protein